MSSQGKGRRGGIERVGDLVYPVRQGDRVIMILACRMCKDEKRPPEDSLSERDGGCDSYHGRPGHMLTGSIESIDHR